MTLKYASFPGEVATSGPVWRELRNFCLPTLGDLGYNKRFIDNRVQEEIPHVLDVIERYIGQPFDIKSLTQMSISNIACSIVYGKRYDYQVHHTYRQHEHCV